ncbi:MAG: hypothetical protein HYR72_14135 [Deltaproteobacteria bacterium]|nr:hypothetical protein [Deltaproteobacteria bacterium]MBI3391484.1 hypothetical protein [Deltaproteobacteria bacterium]
MRSIFERLALLLFGICAALAVGEIAVRMHRSDRISFNKSLAERERSSKTPKRTIMDVLRPNGDEVFRGVRYRFNSVGIRGPEYADHSGTGVFRIVIVGDSVTMGHGVQEEDTYSALLEAALNARGSERRYEVINLGLSNLNLASAVYRLRASGLPLHPDLIVYGFTINDIESPAYVRSTKGPDGDAHRDWLYRFRHSHSFLMRALWPRLVSLDNLREPSPGSYLFELRENYFDNPEAWASFEVELDRLRDVATSSGACVHVLIHTHLYYLGALHPFGSIYDRVARAVEARGMTVTQSYPFFRRLDESRLVVSWFDSHPNAAGHQVLATALLAGLRDLPGRCWKEGAVPDAVEFQQANIH